MVQRFNLGWTCDVRDPDGFSRAVRTALDTRDEIRETEVIRRLLAFHSPENFGRLWLEGIRRRIGARPKPALTWEWVEEALVTARPEAAADAIAP